MRPHIIVNVAMSADGKLSTRERRQVKISGVQDFNRVDRLKAGQRCGDGRDRDGPRR